MTFITGFPLEIMKCRLFVFSRSKPVMDAPFHKKLYVHQSEGTTVRAG